MSATARFPDGPRRGDQPRMRAAREVSRLMMQEAVADYSRIMLRALRAEVRTVVRSASPFLLSMLEREGVGLDQVMEAMLPADGWPFDGGPNLGRWAKSPRAHHLMRHHAAHVAWPGSSIPPIATATIPSGDFDQIVVEVIEHSLEVRAQIGQATIGTYHGILELFVQQAFPSTVLDACADRPIDQIVDLERLRGRGWLIESAKDHSLYTDCTVFKVRTGNVACRLPRG